MNVVPRPMVFTMAVALAAVLACTATDAKAAVVHTFNNIAEQVMDARAVYSIIQQNEPFDITNNSGVTWFDFHVTLEGQGDFGPYDFMQFTDLGANGVIYTGPGAVSFTDDNLDALGLNEAMHIDGLNIPHGAVLSFTADIFGGAAPEGMTSFQIHGQPSIPEPSTIAILGMGTLALLGGHRRRRASV